jgi:hypothetical protein
VAGSSAASRLARRARGRCRDGALLGALGRGHGVGFKGAMLRGVTVGGSWPWARGSVCGVARGVEAASRLLGREGKGKRESRWWRRLPGRQGRPARVRGCALGLGVGPLVGF